MTEHLWLTAATACRVTACDTADHDPHGRSLGGPRRLPPGDPRFHRGDRGAGSAHALDGVPSGRSPTRRRLVESVRRNWRPRPNETAVSAVDPGGDALVTACRAVGQCLGIEVRAPQTGGDRSSGRLERPAGRPGPSLRLSRAAGDASATAGGDAVAASRCWASSTDEGHAPVALVPVEAARALGSGPLTSCTIPRAAARPSTIELAGRIAPTAWMFYRPLPDEPLEVSPTWSASA